MLMAWGSWSLTCAMWCRLRLQLRPLDEGSILPALSSPTIRMRISFSLLFTFLMMVSRPMLPEDQDQCCQGSSHHQVRSGQDS